MTDLIYVYATGAIVAGLILARVFRRDFDPFAPVWLFIATYAQIYVVQAISHREYALGVRGPVVVSAANFRSLWALAWFLAVYYCGLGRVLARKLPRPPTEWSPTLVMIVSPPLAIWGLLCAGWILRTGPSSAGETLVMQFPVFLLVAGALLLVTGRQPDKPRPAFTIAGVLIVAVYGLIWMFNAKRSHSVFAVLVGTCAFYIPRWRRPGILGMVVTAFACVMAVTVAIGWRGTTKYDQSPSGFLQYIGDIKPSSILASLSGNEEGEEFKQGGEQPSKETQEYGGLLLMMDTVPAKSPYDYGQSYLRIFSSYIPRVAWPDKPLYGRPEWVSAWIAGSEFPRDETFTGPSIGVLGACQLNGGAIGTAMVMGVLALLLRAAYDYFRQYADVPWVQAWYALSFYNAWLMPLNDDPFVWFYYLYGHTTLPPLLLFWIILKFATPRALL